MFKKIHEDYWTKGAEYVADHYTLDQILENEVGELEADNDLLVVHCEGYGTAFFDDWQAVVREMYKVFEQKTTFSDDPWYGKNAERLLKIFLMESRLDYKGYDFWYYLTEINTAETFAF